MRVAIVLTAAFAALATLPYAAWAQGGAAAKIEVKQKAPYGKYLTDANGRALYLFTADAAGSSNCYDACAQTWPPLTSGGHPVAGAGLQSTKLSTLARKDGTQQVTYNRRAALFIRPRPEAGYGSRRRGERLRRHLVSRLAEGRQDRR